MRKKDEASEFLARKREERYRRRKKAVTEALAAMPSDEETRAKLAITDDNIKALEEIAAGRVKRNSNAVLQALKIKLEYSLSRPTQKIEASGVSVIVNTLPPEPAPEPQDLEE